MPNLVTQAFFESGLVPVVVLRQAEKGAALARAIRAGGLNSMEITLRTNTALEAIRQAAYQVPDVLAKKSHLNLDTKVQYVTKK